MEENFLKILAIQAIIINEENQILLKLREKDPDNGKWELIAGYLKPGERLKETVARKIKEDADIENYESIEFTGKYYDDPNRHPRKICIPLSFIVKVKKESVATTENLKWFTKEEIENMELALDNKTSITDSVS